MCAPKSPKIEKTPVRQTQKLPDNGDVTASAANRKRQRISAGMLALSAAGGLNAPTVTKMGV